MNANALDSDLTAEDRERILEMLVQYGGLNPDRLYKGSSRAGYRGDQVHAGLKAGDAVRSSNRSSSCPR